LKQPGDPSSSDEESKEDRETIDQIKHQREDDEDMGDNMCRMWKAKDWDEYQMIMKKDEFQGSSDSDSHDEETLEAKKFVQNLSLAEMK
jgi:hypothetical protein